jgi:hypothetical protein
MWGVQTTLLMFRSGLVVSRSGSSSYTSTRARPGRELGSFHPTGRGGQNHGMSCQHATFWPLTSSAAMVALHEKCDTLAVAYLLEGMGCE